MATRLGELLDSERRRTFVGRRREMAGFDEAVAGRSSHRVLFVHGPGGIGKTTLLLELRARARAAGRSVVLLHGREVDASPEGFENAIVAALGRARDGGSAAVPLVSADLLVNAVLLVDGYEQLAPIDPWLRDEFIPALAADDVVVLAGRDAPAAHGGSMPDGATSSRYIGWIPSTRPRVVSSPRSPTEEMTIFIELDDVTLNVRDCGAGEPVVLLHGWPDTADLWRHQIPALLANRYRAIAPDLRGFGESSRPTQIEAYTAPRMVADVIGVLDSLAVERAHLVGHDCGAPPSPG